MLTRVEHLQSVARSLAHVPEAPALAAAYHDLAVAAGRVVAFHATAYRPPGRLADLLDKLAEVLDPGSDLEDPADWDVIEWRRRCAAAGVAQSLLLQRAVTAALAAGVPRPHSLNDIPREIAAEVAADLSALALEGTTP